MSTFSSHTLLCVFNLHKCILFVFLSKLFFFFQMINYFNCNSGLFSNNEDLISFGFINPHCYTNTTKRHKHLECQSSVHASMCNTYWDCKVLSILCATIVCVVPTVYWCVYMKLCLHVYGLVYLGWIMDYVPFLIFLLYLYMYLLCDNKRFWTWTWTIIHIFASICKNMHILLMGRRYRERWVSGLVLNG